MLTRDARRLVAFALLISAFMEFGGAAVAQVLKPAQPLRVAFASGVTPGLSPLEAEASIEVWAKELARNRGIGLNATTKVYGDLDALAGDMAAGNAHLVTMTTEQYWRLHTPALVSVLIGQRGGATPSRSSAPSSRSPRPAGRPCRCSSASGTRVC